MNCRCRSKIMQLTKLRQAALRNKKCVNRSSNSSFRIAKRRCTHCLRMSAAFLRSSARFSLSRRISSFLASRSWMTRSFSSSFCRLASSLSISFSAFSICFRLSRSLLSISCPFTVAQLLQLHTCAACFAIDIATPDSIRRRQQFQAHSVERTNNLTAGSRLKLAKVIARVGHIQATSMVSQAMARSNKLLVMHSS